MYRIPRELNLDRMIGHFSTQLRVGQYDLQFTFGEIDFRVQSAISLIQDGEVIGVWEEGKWPSDKFFEIMNVEVIRYDIPNDRTIIIYLNNNIEIHLKDDSDQYECIQINIEGEDGEWII